MTFVPKIYLMMEALLKKELGTSTLKAFGTAGGGCISSGQSYITDSGKVFVKVNGKKGVRISLQYKVNEFRILLPYKVNSKNKLRISLPYKVNGKN